MTSGHLENLLKGNDVPLAAGDSRCTSREVPINVNTDIDVEEEGRVAVSPTSSQGSWVVTPEGGGWDGLDQVQPLSTSNRLREVRIEPHQRQLSSPSTSLLGSWAALPSSSVTVEFPPSPPLSPGSVRSKGLAGLARDEARVSTDGLAAALDSAISSVDGREAKANDERVAVVLQQGHGDLECESRRDLDVDTGETRVSASVGIAANDGQTAAIAEEASNSPKEDVVSSRNGRTASTTLESISVVIPSPATSCSSRSSSIGAVSVHHGMNTSHPRPTTPPITASPRRGISGEESSQAMVSQPVDRVESSRSSSSTGIPEGNPDEMYHGRNMERLWKWPGLSTAAKAGVVPIILAIITLSSSNGSRNGRGGEGSNARGGGGPTRCSSRRRPLGGGGGGDGDSMHIDPYGCMVMPYCVAPCIFAAA